MRGLLKGTMIWVGSTGDHTPSLSSAYIDGRGSLGARSGSEVLSVAFFLRIYRF